jgi:hypothetical protein
MGFVRQGGEWVGHRLGSALGFEGGIIEDPSSPPTSPDLTDAAVREAEEQQRRRGVFGSRRSSMLTGPLGDRSQIPTMTTSILGE